MEEENKINSGIDNDIEGWKPKKPRQPQEASEGVDTTRAADTTQFAREGYLGAPPGAVSLTKIAVSDLISEGRIDGIVSGYHTYVGTAENTGWASAVLTNWENAPNTSIPWLRSVYWNQVPVVNPNNEYNFQAVNINFTPGLPNGSTSTQISSEATVVRQIGERLRYGPDFVKIYRILNKNAKAIDVNIRINQLSESITSSSNAGDVVESTVKYTISYRPLSNDPSTNPTLFTVPTNGQEVVRGKISAGYVRYTRISLIDSAAKNFTQDPNFLGWELKIERLTPDSTTSSIRNQTFIENLIEVYGDVFSYPNSALVHAKFSAEYFSAIPTRSYEVKGLQVMIPSNYSPLTRSYGRSPFTSNIGNDWDGTFLTNGAGAIAKEWTDNPAWCYFDLLTNRNYGLGKYITGNDISVDKWTLYDIGRYCDVLVSDGYGGLEPRLSCNIVINNREEAFKVINNMTSIFRGMAYYGAGTVLTVQDSPKKPYLLFTNSNVENGDFAYSSSSRRVRHTVAIVRYNDKKNFYKPALEYVEDVEGIRRYGVREVELAAVGCTSRGQAVRLGRWALLTETSEIEVVNFVAGLEGALVRPGDVIEVADRNKRGMRFGGRTYRINNPSTITLDSSLPTLTATNLYNFQIVTPTWCYDPALTSSLLASDISGIRKPHIQTQTFRGNQATTTLGADDVYRTQITFSDPFSYIDPITNAGNYSLSGNLIWMIDSSGASDQMYNIIDQFRVVNVHEKEPHKYNISAIEYNLNKYNQIESGLNFGTQTIIDAAPSSPKDLNLDVKPVSTTSKTQNVKKIDYNFTAPDAGNVSKYLVYVKFGTDFIDSPSDVATNRYLVNVLPQLVTNGTYIPLDNGIYYFRVYAATAGNVKSAGYAGKSTTIGGINPLQDIIISSLALDAESTVYESNDPASATSNSYGSREAGVFTTSDPTFTWQVGFQNNTLINVNLTGIGYKISIRQPSTTNTPNPNVYFNVGAQLTGKFGNLSYTFPFDDNKILPNGPFRNFDVVVEAVNTHNKTSAAGGYYENPVGTKAESTFNNTYSYDIFSATNPAINDFRLNDPTKNIVSLYDTEQWITSDGSIKLLVKKNIPPDWAGGIAYVWTGFNTFTEEQALKQFNPTLNEYINADTSVINNIIRIPFIGSGENGLITIPTGITGYSAAYMAISPLDSFDAAMYENGTLTDNRLFMSNRVKIQKRLGFNEKLLFNSWVETNVDYNNNNVPVDWTNYAVGIKSINCEPYNDILENNSTKFKWEFSFDKPLPSTNYVVMATNSGVNIRENSQIIKFVDKVQLYRFKGKQFFAVLYNGASDPIE